MAQVSSSLEIPDHDDASDSAIRSAAIRLVASPDWFFLAVAIAIGIVLLLLTPPIQSPDEDFHFMRAYQLSEGCVVSVKHGDETGGDVPVSLIQLVDRFAHLPFYEEQKTTFAEIREALSIPLNADKRQFVGFSTIAVQPPLGHCPQALGLLLSRQVTQSVLVSLYVGRIFNLLAAVTITFWAIRRTPVAKWGFAAIALMPMSLFLMASLSSDAITIALTSLFLAEFFRCAFGDAKRLAAADICRLAGLGVIVGGLIKQSYFPLALCFLLIPANKFGSARRYGYSMAIVLGATFASTAAWGFVVKDIYSPARLTQGINAKEQLELICSDPGSLVKTLGSTLFYQFRTKVRQFVGILGWLDVPIPSAARTLDLICLVVFFLTGFNPGQKLKTWQVLVALGVASTVSVLVLVLLHLTWNPVGFPYVRFQGRYFIPVAPLIGVAFSRLGRFWAPAILQRLRQSRPLIAACLPGILLVSVWSVYQRYYVDSPEAAIKRHVRFAYARLERGESLSKARPGLRDSLQLIADDKRSTATKRLVTCLLEARDSSDAIRQLIAIGSTSRKSQATLFLTLGKILTADGDYAGALTCFEKSDELVSGSEFTAFALWSVRDLSRKMEFIQQAILKQTHPGSIELCSAETGGEPVALRLPLEQIVTTYGGSTIGSLEMVWRRQPPSGETIGVDQGEWLNTSEAGPSSFCACAAALIPPYFTPTMDKPFPTIVGKRVFVFPPPLNAVLLNDEQVSWYYQRRMIDLGDEEIERELAYRAERQLTFPLNALPE